MKMNNTCRFLFESALYLDLNPAQSFRKLCAEPGHAPADSRADERAGDAWPLLICGY